jgi:hypothetical protein
MSGLKRTAGDRQSSRTNCNPNDFEMYISKSRRQPDLTTAPVAASPINRPEWCDSPGAKELFGLKRSMLYELLTRGAIDGCSLRKRGAVKGKRLWNCDSIRHYLQSQMKRAK